MTLVEARDACRWACAYTHSCGNEGGAKGVRKRGAERVVGLLGGSSVALEGVCVCMRARARVCVLVLVVVLVVGRPWAVEACSARGPGGGEGGVAALTVRARLPPCAGAVFGGGIALLAAAPPDEACKRGRGGVKRGLIEEPPWPLVTALLLPVSEHCCDPEEGDWSCSSEQCGHPSGDVSPRCCDFPCFSRTADTLLQYCDSALSDTNTLLRVPRVIPSEYRGYSAPSTASTLLRVPRVLCYENRGYSALCVRARLLLSCEQMIPLVFEALELRLKLDEQHGVGAAADARPHTQRTRVKRRKIAPFPSENPQKTRLCG
eukprot:646452-Pleurochrysis_carterae.AAC.5